MTTQQDSVDVERLRAALELTVGQLTAIREANDPDDPDSYRCDDREGCLDWTHAAAAEAEKAGLAALSLPITQRDEQGEWRGMADAPRDGRYILAEIAQGRDGHLAHQAGRMFVIRHAGVMEDGFDMGWNLHPGYGGCSDHDFAGWMPAPQPAAIRRLSIEQGDQDGGGPTP